MNLAINQPTYLPWLGYFDLIDQVDLFVVLDCVQFEKQSWQQRNRIRTSQGLQWLAVPVKAHGRFGQLIRDVEIGDCDFWRKHERAIELAYRRCAFFGDYFPRVHALLQGLSSGSLVDLNLGLLQWLIEVLEIRTRVIRASSLGQPGKRTELLANICRCVGASEYISPPGSAAYLQHERRIFADCGIEIRFQNYQHPEYKQLYTPFLAFASVIDLVFNEGKMAATILRSGRREGIPAARFYETLASTG